LNDLVRGLQIGVSVAVIADFMARHEGEVRQKAVELGLLPKRKCRRGTADRPRGLFQAGWRTPAPNPPSPLGGYSALVSFSPRRAGLFHGASVLVSFALH
jgi:hypothetical protein